MTISTARHSRATLVITSHEGHEMLVQAMVNIPVEQAAAATGLHTEIVRQLIRAGVLPGSSELCDLERAQEIAAEIAAACAPVEGRGVGVTDAAKQYGFSRDSIYKWIKDGWVRVVRQEPTVLVNEGDMVLARELAMMQGGHIEGRAVFPHKPIPGRPKKPR
ncbi:MAG: hypothetical protein WCG26_11380 [Chloroflexales bacterium]